MWLHISRKIVLKKFGFKNFTILLAAFAAAHYFKKENNSTEQLGRTRINSEGF